MEVKEYSDINEVNHFAEFVSSVKDKALVRKINTRIVYLGLGNFGTHRNLTGGIGEINEQGSAPVILICRSGKRSFEAGMALMKGGFHNIYNIDEGFEGELDDDHQRSSVGGWRFRGLPWEQC